MPATPTSASSGPRSRSSNVGRPRRADDATSRSVSTRCRARDQPAIDHRPELVAEVCRRLQGSGRGIGLVRGGRELPAGDGEHPHGREERVVEPIADPREAFAVRRQVVHAIAVEEGLDVEVGPQVAQLLARSMTRLTAR